MKSFLATATAVLLWTTAAGANKRDLCSDGSVDDGGNWYCQKVQAVTYTNVGGKGQYNRITNMGSDGHCAHSPMGYSGNVAPLDQEVSLHFRGPLHLKQFAFYAPGTAKSKRNEDDLGHLHVHGRRGQLHRHVVRQVGAMVTATINGQVVSWRNQYGGPSTATSSSSVQTQAAASQTSQASSSHTLASPQTSPSSGSRDSSSSNGQAWTRGAYYNAASGTSEGLVFLNHFGGCGSGTFDMTYGNSLSFASSDGTKGSADRQVLADVVLPSSAEVIIMSDDHCGGNDGACGYYRDGIKDVAHHGFDGAAKAFFFEFQMPHETGSTAASEYDPVDMPAIWMLNALIPRTLQYGNEQCSCWQSGCGEFDMFEVLSAGDNRMKSTLHGNVAGGDSDYFERPVNASIKAAAILYNDNIHLRVLDDNTDFGDAIDFDKIESMCSETLVQSEFVSLFKLGG
ncbi:hypothetical protein K470DRAFT_273393 [Piedraia hortae CBS 480.64]|uniref:glucan endo-1,3-beta-D-glucosidase n=1 Tax=Piedraia hortae CBS 480.64 TaxID=1314780 RepID=A0A6A7BPP9_9PEZI|nr:hypothetical protein K470DRAFT_273393 [Piedraia hortae CBS 480.64]